MITTALGDPTMQEAGHAVPLFFQRRPPRHRARTLFPSRPQRPTQDGSPLAQAPRLYARGYRTACGRFPQFRPTLPHRVPQRRTGATPPLSLDRPTFRPRQPPHLLGGLFPPTPATVHPRGSRTHPPTHRYPPRLDPGPPVLTPLGVEA